MARSTRCCTIVASGWQQPPAFLAPAWATSTSIQPQQSHFSTTSVLGKRHADRNRKRGISALRGTGPRFPLSVSNVPLPRPVLDASKRTQPKADPAHGLWQFFGSNKKALMTPEELAAHGRAWSVQELRNKSWEDLSSLWWVCAKERNRIATQEFERQRVGAGYGEHEADARDGTVRNTQRAIKHVLTERWYAYQNAWKEVNADPALSEQLKSSQAVSQGANTARDISNQNSSLKTMSCPRRKRHQLSQERLKPAQLWFMKKAFLSNLRKQTVLAHDLRLRLNSFLPDFYFVRVLLR